MQTISSQSSFNPTVPSVNPELQVETIQQRTQRFTRTVTLVTFILVALLTFLGLMLSIFVSWQAWGSTTLGAILELLPVALSWWLARFTAHYRVAAWLNTSASLLIVLLLYWQAPFFGLYLLFVFQLIIVRLILGRTETVLVFGIILINTLLYSILNQNGFFAPDGQLVKVDYGTFVLWWLIIGGVTWLTSFLYDTVQRDNRTLNLQAAALRQALEELQQKQQASQTESQRVLTLGVELSTIAKQQLVESQEQVGSLTQVAGFVEEMAHAADNIKTQTYQVRESATEIGGLAEAIQNTFGEVMIVGRAGEEATSRTITATHQVEGQYLQLREHLTELAQLQSQIRSVIEIIKTVSGETHLLSLNAAIEAAGAGVYGGRFAVVAGEVKNLAKRAQHSSEQVTAILGKVESGIDLVVGAAESAQTQVEIALVATSECGEMMERIIATIERNVQQVNQISDAVSQINRQSNEVSSATTQQSSASSLAAENLLQIKTVAARNSQVSEQLSQSASNLKQVSTNLVASLSAGQH